MTTTTATKSVKPQIIYTKRGAVERGANYTWCDGYSATTAEGYVLYPWMTKAECRRDANKQGTVAVFVDPDRRRSLARDD